MSRNVKNIGKFAIAVAALALFGYCISKAETDEFNLWHIAGIIVSVDVGIWYLWHVFKDKL